MNDELEYLIWQYVDNNLSAIQKEDLFNQIAVDPIAKQKLEDIQAVHDQLQNLPVTTPEKSLGNMVMNNITNAEIDAQIQSTPTYEKSLIPIILILFGGLILAAIIIIFFTSKSGDSSLLPAELPVSDKALSFIGYLGILIFSLLVLYKISFTQKKAQ